MPSSRDDGARSPTRPPARGSRRSSAGWTPARPGCARRSSSARRAGGWSSSAPPSSTRSGAGSRSCGSTSWSPGSRPAAPRSEPPAQPVLVGPDEPRTQREQRDLRAAVGGRHVLQAERAAEMVELGGHDVLGDVRRRRDVRRRTPACTPSPSPISGRQSARRMRCCCSENFGATPSSPGASVTPSPLRPGSQNAIEVWPDPHQVAVDQPTAAVDPQPVDVRPVLGEAVVAQRPLAGLELELGVQPRDLRVPGQRDVGLAAGGRP